MDVFLTLLGIGFLILCFAILISLAGIFGYVVKLAKKKLEVAPIKVNSKSNDTDE